MIISVLLRESVMAIDRPFDYRVPVEKESDIKVGQLVRVPFGISNRLESALIIDVFEKSEHNVPLKEIKEVVDIKPMVDSSQIELIRILRSRYACTYGDIIRLIIPSSVSDKKQKNMRVAYVCNEEEAVEALAQGDLSSLQQIRVLEMLLESKCAPIIELMSALSVSDSPIKSLAQKGLVSIEKRQFDVVQACDSNDSEYIVEDILPIPRLTSAQKEAVRHILNASDRYKEYLLFGVTGSGKTEVYLQCTQDILDRDGSVLFLVPEISLTPQMIRWVTSRFPQKTAVIHSRLTPRERYEQWNMIRSGEARIVIGARSAVFAPIYNLKMIIMDEEQDSSYKSETHPRYHARDVARIRARLLNIPIVLGSATPSIETYFAAEQGFSQLLKLPDRVLKATLPEVEIIDMRRELMNGNRSIISGALYAALKHAIEKGEQAILFLNKRGFSSFLLCRACGNTMMCPRCSVSMTLHTAKRRQPMMVCHYCMYVEKKPPRCKSCESDLLGRMGAGTQQLEEAVQKEFPHASIVRMDQDTTIGKGSHARLLDVFRNKEANILIGTQMIAKGHDFPSVSVVGIISADLLIRADDYRAGERAFQLITQASGRAGRGDIPGTVYIQTYQPEDDTILFAADQDYDAFFKNEIEFRRRMKYPPFLAMGSIMISHNSEENGKNRALQIKNDVENIAKKHFSGVIIEVFGPGPALVFRLRDRFRYKINVKAQNKSILAQIFQIILANNTDKDCAVSVDIDPLW